MAPFITFSQTSCIYFFFTLIIQVWFKTVAFQSHSSSRRYLLSEELVCCCLFVCLLIKDFLDTCANFALPRVLKCTELCTQSHTVTHQDKQERMHTYVLSHTRGPLCAITSQLFTSLRALAVWWAAGKQPCSHHTRRMRCPCQWDGTRCVTPSASQIFRPPSHFTRHLLTQVLFPSLSSKQPYYEYQRAVSAVTACVCYLLLLADRGWNAYHTTLPPSNADGSVADIGNKGALCLKSSQWWPSRRLLVQQTEWLLELKHMDDT